MTWELVLTSSYKRRFKKMTDWLRSRAKDAMEDLYGSEDPKRIARPKKGWLEGCYGYDLSSDCRILFSVDENLRQIIFHRVCSHKEVYR